jgi:thioredoxin reductase (NADPH)
VLDCLIIGGGPAGLTAAIYLARYRRTVAVHDEGESRALRMPTSHNYPGFPTGISGRELLQLLKRKVDTYNVPMVRRRITGVEKIAEGFKAHFAEGWEKDRNVQRRFAFIRKPSLFFPEPDLKLN